ncbi:hypothetical protein Pfo_008132 [Paulownia fortunei]|nr:hypothetical protein Pfo_008132 [Paulownia fortunei]
MDSIGSENNLVDSEERAMSVVGTSSTTSDEVRDLSIDSNSTSDNDLYFNEKMSFFFMSEVLFDLVINFVYVSFAERYKLEMVYPNAAKFFYEAPMTGKI